MGCEQCGAADGGECAASFDRLLALEFENREGFAVHHLTVACYLLQHPAGYDRGAVESWWNLLNDVLLKGIPAAVVQRRMSEQYEGARRVRREGSTVPEGWPRRWPMTVEEVVQPEGQTASPGIHVERVRAWARSVLDTLNDSRSLGRR